VDRIPGLQCDEIFFITAGNFTTRVQKRQERGSLDLYCGVRQEQPLSALDGSYHRMWSQGVDDGIHIWYFYGGVDHGMRRGDDMRERCLGFPVYMKFYRKNSESFLS
jgi:hypothetical protein